LNFYLAKKKIDRGSINVFLFGLVLEFLVDFRMFEVWNRFIKVFEVFFRCFWVKKMVENGLLEFKILTNF
jgi:hypothetical protein